MQSITREEIELTAKTLAKEAETLMHISEMDSTTNSERKLCLLIAEQYQGIAIKLMAAVKSGDCWIVIRQT